MTAEQFDEATWRLVEWHTDAGHSWLRIPLELVEPARDKISGYSYKDNEFAYLEEDCDAWAFLDYWGMRSMVDAFDEVDDGRDSPIRHKQPWPQSASWRSPFERRV